MLIVPEEYAQLRDDNDNPLELKKWNQFTNKSYNPFILANFFYNLKPILLFTYFKAIMQINKFHKITLS